MKYIFKFKWAALALMVSIGFGALIVPGCGGKPTVVNPPVVVSDTLQNKEWYCTPIAPKESIERTVSMRGKAWPVGSVIRIGFLNGQGTAAQKQMVKDAYARWSASDAANLKFEFPETGSTNIRVSFTPGSAWSYIGVDCNSIAQNQPTLNFGFGGPSTIEHEAGHSLGLLHEQQLAGGICWNEANVISDLSGPPNRWNLATIRFNVLDYHNPANIITSGYDKNSIMHYSIPARWTCNGIAIPGGSNISAADKYFVNQVLYPYPVQPPPPPTSLTITRAKADSIKTAAKNLNEMVARILK